MPDYLTAAAAAAADDDDDDDDDDDGVDDDVKLAEMSFEQLTTSSGWSLALVLTNFWEVPTPHTGGRCRLLINSVSC